MARLAILRVRDGEGAVRATWLSDDGGLTLDDGTGARAIAPAIIEAVFTRYGKPLAAEAPRATDGVAITLPDGTRALVSTFRFRGFGDVEPTDYLLLDVDGREALAGPATLLAAALGHLARAAVAS